MNLGNNMSNFKTTWERVDEDSPDRCQYIMPNTGQCRIKAVEDSQYCPAHGGNKAYQAKEKKDLRNYRLNKFKQRVGELSANDAIFSLKEEIGILRLLIEEKLNQCNDNAELMLISGPLSDLVMKADKLVTSCNRLDRHLGNSLDKGRVLQFAQTIVQIIGNHISDDEILEKISSQILEALE